MTRHGTCYWKNFNCAQIYYHDQGHDDYEINDKLYRREIICNEEPKCNTAAGEIINVDEYGRYLIFVPDTPPAPAKPEPKAFNLIIGHSRELMSS